MTFNVAFGITQGQIKQLLHYSKTDSRVKRYTSDPVRFKDKKVFEKWRKEGRAVYTLVDKKGDLCGLVWFGRITLPSEKFIKDVKRQDFGITFAIRTYGKARGKGYAAYFMKKAFELFTSSTRYKSAKNKGVWLATSYDNIAAIKTYEKFGFVKVTRPDKKGKILMILPRD